ncbi:universal stress protein [Algihabitans albus]|uniref:universal stress protein n=1 Tax=Algihabitans albus TaxID=2164067 RepID=UPI000E5D29CC|nr:universal stress protein [Algihabitans albus]
MYKKIMVPVDLAHTDRLEKALKTAGDLARHYEIPVCYVGVTASTPDAVARSPEEYARKLTAFGAAQAQEGGFEATTRSFLSRDPTRELYKLLTTAADEIGADLVIMASHIPGLPEHILTSNAGYVASHSDVSVFVIR